MMRLKLWISHKQLLLIAFLVCYQELLAQNQNIPIQHAYNIELEASILESAGANQTSFKPILESRINYKPKVISFLDTERKWVSSKLFFDHFIKYDSADVQFFIDPILNFEFGVDNGNSARKDITQYTNTRGFQLRLNLGEKVSIQSSFRENQANLLSYVHNRTKVSREAFGQGRVKSFGGGGFDFNMASSAFSYSPTNNLNIQLGHGKHFVGQGHRSFLLSDLAFNYPFIRINSRWLNNKLSYQNLFTLFQNIERLPSDFESEGLFQRNQAAIHYIEYSITNHLNIGLFESNIWVNKDTSDFDRVGVNYWVPIILINSVFDNKAISTNLGITANYTGIKRLNLYSQIATNNLIDSAINYQIGAKYYLNSIPLRFNIEYYSSSNFDQNYVHYESSLGHPLQSDFSELIFGMTFKKKRVWSTVQLNFIESSDEQLMFYEFRQAYIVNPSTSLALVAGIRYREYDFLDEQTNYIFIGLSTNLQNIYFDY